VPAAAVFLENAMTTLSTPHSAHYLNDTRDLWWNADFLELVATRTGLRRVQRALDVGAGLGHWTRTVASLLSPGAHITGIEREATWVERAMGTVDRAANDVVIDFVQGDVHALPWPDHTFDLVTSQTVLIHIPDPAAALVEMVRVLRPGGVLLCAEPNNLGQSVSSLVGDPHFDIDDVVALFRLQATCEKGKHALGLGYNSIGEHLVRFMPDTVDLLGVWNNDRCTTFRNGDDHSARPEVLDALRVNDDGFGWPRDEAHRYFLAGGGDPATFDSDCARANRLLRDHWHRTAQGAGRNEGGLFYVLAARKSEAR
jgi:SAM-dependent methyltransferase